MNLRKKFWKNFRQHRLWRAKRAFYIAKLIESRSSILEKAKANISAAQEKQKADYDRKHANPTVYKVGSKVLAKDFLRRKRKEGKLDYRWLGPYVIMKNLGKGESSNRIECGK